MKAIIIAAGYATRLYPLTKNRPKALLTINGKAIADYICDEIDTIDDIEEIILVSNHKFAGNFLKWADKRKGVKHIKIIDDGSTCEENRLGAIGDIKFALDREHIQEDVLVVAGDNFFTYRLADFYRYYRTVKRDCIIVQEVSNREDLCRMGVVRTDEASRVIDLEEKPENPRSNMAVYASYIYREDTLPLFDVYLREGNKPDAPGYFPAWLYKRKDVRAYVFEGECFDIGTHEALSGVRKKFRRRAAQIERIGE